ncbi:MBL fold metallo-hydrolase [Nocardioides sp. R1-1]|uniref:MBL fold metallo-hydrolase n=1 Tax=Nocardioides sp. R1-1 TaxID=3383502 RepID=UPI0038D22FEC
MAASYGPHDLGRDCFAWLVGEGGWGESNSGLVRGSGESLLVDTLIDLTQTRQMLEGIATLVEDHPIRTVVNTHADGDHWFGNELVAGPGVEIIASESAAASMTAAVAAELASLWAREDRVGDFVRSVAGSFDPTGVTATAPTRTFSGELDLDVGGRHVRLVQVGPAHTAGDVVVHVPDAKVVYTGDILFIGGAPLVWDGPLSRCIAACDLLLDLDVTTVVPGHGPVTGKEGVARVRDYLVYVEQEATRRFEAGLDLAEAIASIDLSGFPEMSEHERIAANVTNVYEQLDPAMPRAGRLEQFDLMASVHLCARTAGPADGTPA